MYRTTIIFNEKETPIKFGVWVHQEIAKAGINIDEVLSNLEKHLFEFIPLIVELGVINAVEGRRNGDVPKFDGYDWIDSLDGSISSDEVKRVLEVFLKQVNEMTKGLQEDKPKAKPKAEAKKK